MLRNIINISASFKLSQAGYESMRL